MPPRALATSASEYIPVRLLPGADLRVELEQIFRAESLTAAAVTAAVGSLATAVLRFAGATAGTTLSGPFEIVSLTGTLSADGAHLHITLADALGACLGGHLLPGSRIFTTAEVVILSFPELAFQRPVDDTTGHRELCITTRNSSATRRSVGFFSE